MRCSFCNINISDETSYAAGRNLDHKNLYIRCPKCGRLYHKITGKLRETPVKPAELIPQK